LTIISISVPERLLERIDISVGERGFASRSEIIRQALRGFLREDKSLRDIEGKVVATITIIYERETNRERISNIQHDYGHVVSTFLHAHIDENYCLEVIVVKGEASLIRKLVDALRANEEISQIKTVVLEKTNI
jgi:CopG family nickel-responsive transcriptional regulator